jgi:hypothetical protein
MIYLQKGQPLFENSGMVVCDQTGYYEDGATVVCAPLFAPDEPACRFEAKFIAYGSQVYNITDQDKLMEEINKIDPKSLLGKSTEEISIDNMVKNIQTTESSQDTGTDASIPTITDQGVPDITQSELPQDNTSTTTPQMNSFDTTVPDTGIGTSTVDEVVPKIENVIEELKQVSDVVEQAVATSSKISNLAQ